MNNSLIILTILLLSTACSHQNMYEAVKANRSYECAKLPQTAQGKCMARINKSYDEYEAERQNLLKNDN